VLLGGDWKQLLPVYHQNRNESMKQVILHSLLSWQLFPLFTTLKLTQNMRAGEGEEEFAK